jgi:hypothetical protein
MNEHIGWLNPWKAFEASRSILSNMSLAELKLLHERDPELAQHYGESFPDVKEWGGFNTIEEAQDFINQSSADHAMADLMAWGDYKTEDEAQAFIDAN